MDILKQIQHYQIELTWCFGDDDECTGVVAFPMLTGGRHSSEFGTVESAVMNCLLVNHLEPV